jgi:hypothetical protein
MIQHVSRLRVGAVTKVLAFTRMRDPEERVVGPAEHRPPSSPAANDAIDERGLAVIRHYDPVDDLDERLARIDDAQRASIRGRLIPNSPGSR